MNKKRLATLTLLVLTVFASSVLTLALAQDKPADPGTKPGKAEPSQVAPAKVEVAADSGMSAGGPRIFLPEPEHDFGVIQRGAKAVHVFKVKNTGDEPLQLIKAKGS